MQDTFPMTLGTTFMRRFLWCRKIKSLGKNPRECICGQRTEMLRGLKSFINTTHLGNGPLYSFSYHMMSTSTIVEWSSWPLLLLLIFLLHGIKCIDMSHIIPFNVCSLFRSAPSQCPSFRHTREKGFGPHEEEWEGGIFLIEKLLSLFYSEAHHNFHDGDWNVSVKKWGLTSFLVHKLLNSKIVYELIEMVHWWLIAKMYM